MSDAPALTWIRSEADTQHDYVASVGLETIARVFLSSIAGGNSAWRWTILCSGLFMDLPKPSWTTSGWETDKDAAVATIKALWPREWERRAQMRALLAGTTEPIHLAAVRYAWQHRPDEAEAVGLVAAAWTAEVEAGERRAAALLAGGIEGEEPTP